MSTSLDYSVYMFFNCITSHILFFEAKQLASVILYFSHESGLSFFPLYLAFALKTFKFVLLLIHDFSLDIT